MVKTSFEKFKEKNRKANRKNRIKYKSDHESFTRPDHNTSLHENSNRQSNHYSNRPSTRESKNSVYSSSIESNRDNMSQEEFQDFEENIRQMPLVELIKIMKKKSAGEQLTAEEEKMILNIENTDITKDIAKKFKTIKYIIIIIFLFAFLKGFF